MESAAFAGVVEKIEFDRDARADPCVAKAAAVGAERLGSRILQGEGEAIGIWR